jgi:hypothetical protein
MMLPSILTPAAGQGAMVRNKRAGLHISLSTLIDIVLVTLALLVLFGIYKAVMSIFADNPDKELASRNNFQRLATELNEMKPGENREIPFYLLDNRFVIGFKKDDTRLLSQCELAQAGFVGYIDRPHVCTGTCLCLCKIGDWCKTGVECRTIDGDFTLAGSNSCPLPLLSGRAKPFIATLNKVQGTISFSAKQ